MRYQNRNNGFPVQPGSAYQGGYPQSMPMNYGGYQQQMPMNPYPYGMPQPPGYGYGGIQGGYANASANASAEQLRPISISTAGKYGGWTSAIQRPESV